MQHLRALALRLIEFGEFAQIRLVLRILVHQGFIRFHGDEPRFERKRRLRQEIVGKRRGDIDRKRVLRASERLQRTLCDKRAAFENRRQTENVREYLLNRVHVRVFCLFRFPEHDSGIKKTRIFLRDLLQQLNPVSQIVFRQNILRLLKRGADRRRDLRQTFFHDSHEKSPFFFDK